MVATASPLLVFVVLLGASVWVGGLVAIAVVARVARGQLDRSARVAFFRSLGRSYGIVGSAALVVALGGGAVLVGGRYGDGSALAAVLVAAALVAVTGAGVAQARGMTRLRARSLLDPADAGLASQVRRGARRAALLRTGIAALTLALLALASVLAA